MKKTIFIKGLTTDVVNSMREESGIISDNINEVSGEEIYFDCECCYEEASGEIEEFIKEKCIMNKYGKLEVI